MAEKGSLLRRAAAFAKKETVLCASALLALVSMALVPVDREYLGYIDFRVLALLFCLMAVMSGFQEAGVFKRLARALLQRTKTVRQLGAILVLLCFFTSMLITNDVALLTFVPFTIMVLEMAGLEHRMIPIVVLQTVGANLGSMLTPVGNPQNLYLYTVSGMSLARFLSVMGPYTLLSLILLLAAGGLEKKTPVNLSLEEPDGALPMGRLFRFSLLFLLCLCTVARLLPYQLVFAAVLAAILVYDRKLLGRVDYCLLLTFTCFFVFIGNMGRIEAVRQAIAAMMEGRELYMGAAASQVISNVPAAILLSGFTSRYEPLLVGVNIGGLGTLIASLASLISYKFYAGTEGSRKMKYLCIFTAVNLLFLAALLALAGILTNMNFNGG